MQTLSNDDISLIDTSLRNGHPFALVLPPGASEPLRWTKTSAPDGARLTISPWLAGADGAATQLDDNAVGQMTLEERSTPASHYLASVGSIVGRCRARHGKTVYSRIECGSIAEHAGWGLKADKLFSLFPGTFRFIYHTPHTLGWIGASPEVLLDFDKTTGHFSTMSLAGTRRNNTAEAWDRKNIHENGFVTDYIAGRLRPLASDIAVSQPQTLGYGAVEHLLHIVSGHASPEKIPDIVAAINPTPALCGFPKDDAIADIAAMELHRRNCYGGFVAIETADRYQAFVNLRCAHFSGRRFCAYGGGGITSESVPEIELAETSAKMSRMLEILYDGRRPDNSPRPNDSLCER